MVDKKTRNDELIRRYLINHDKESLEELVMINQGLISLVMKKIGILERLRGEYVDIGLISLVEAVKTYKEEFLGKCNFASYAYVCIKNDLLVELIKENRYCARADYSLDQPFKNMEDLTLGDMLFYEDENIEKVLSNDENKKIANEIMKVVNTFDEVDQYIITHLFGLNGEERMTQYELADKFNVSVSAISGRYIRCVKHLRKVIKVVNKDIGKELEFEKKTEYKLVLTGAINDEDKQNVLEQTLSDLSERNQKILNIYYGRKGYEKGDIKKISKDVGVSESVVRYTINTFEKRIFKLFYEIDGVSNKNNKKSCKIKI